MIRIDYLVALALLMRLSHSLSPRAVVESSVPKASSSRRQLLRQIPAVTASLCSTGWIVVGESHPVQPPCHHQDNDGTCVQCAAAVHRRGEKWVLPRMTTNPSSFTRPTAWAYERRDVGGQDRSPETAAMNEQAYETNNRLEQAGFKLESSAEQQQALSSLLSDYSYAPAATRTKSTTNAANKGS